MRGVWAAVAFSVGAHLAGGSRRPTRTAKGHEATIEAVAEEAEETVQRATSNESRMQDLDSSTSATLKELGKTSAEAVGHLMLHEISQFDLSEPLGPQLVSVVKHVVVGAAEVILSAINPLLGMVFSLFSGLFGGGQSQEDAQSEMIKAILEECEDMIKDAVSQMHREITNNWVSGVRMTINSAAKDPSQWKTFTHDTANTWAHIFQAPCWDGGGSSSDACTQHRDEGGALLLEIEFVQLMLTSCLSVGQAGYQMNECAGYVAKGANLVGQHFQVVKQQRVAEVDLITMTNTKLEKKVLSLKSAASHLDKLKPFRYKHLGSCATGAMGIYSLFDMFDTITECSEKCEKLKTCKYFAFNPDIFYSDSLGNCFPFTSEGGCPPSTDAFFRNFTTYEALDRPRTSISSTDLVQGVPKNGVYTIKQVASNRYLTAHLSSDRDYSAVTRLKVAENSKWWINSLGGNLYTIKQTSTNRYLTAHQGDNYDYSAVTRPFSENTKWWITSKGSNLYTIKQMPSNRYLDAHQNNDYSAVTRSGISKNNEWVISSA